MKNTILSKLPTECPWRDTLYWYPCVDSTNDLAKHMAKEGAAHGTVIIAGTQTGGRGRMGRSFQSPGGAGMYLSVILRPNCHAAELMHLTCAAGVAAVAAVERAAGIRVGLKWINDLVFENKKLGGILAELSLDAKTGIVDYAIIGIGINCREPEGGFSPDIESIATSLACAGHAVSPEELAAETIRSLWEMSSHLLTEKASIMAAYRKLCVTLGRQIMVIRGESRFPGKAVDMDDDGGLVILLEDGCKETVSSGEVSVRGLWDYV